MFCVLFCLSIFHYPGNDTSLRSLCPLLKELFERIRLYEEEAGKGRDGWCLEEVSVGSWEDWAFPIWSPVVEMSSELTLGYPGHILGFSDMD